MEKFSQKKLVKKALVLGLSLMLAFVLVCGCSAAGLNIMRFGRRNADTNDAPPIGEGLESGAEGVVDRIESGADNVIDGIGNGADNIIDGAESIVDGDTDGMTDGGMLDTNIPDSDIGGAVEDNDSDGISDPTDSDDDNDGTSDVADSDADNDGINDDADTDPDGDGVNESKMSGRVIGIVIAVLVIGAIAVLAYVLMPKKKH